MKDDPNNLAMDQRPIAVEQEHELRYWTKVFSCSEEELRDAVAAVGISAQKVREYFCK
jgi:hypothetical protein